MKSLWSDQAAAEFLAKHVGRCGEDLALRTYASRLLAAEPSLVLHGGGNTSVKSGYRTLLGEDVRALFIKASGVDMAAVEPDGHTALDLARLEKLRGLADITDEEMMDLLLVHRMTARSALPSIETLAHAFIPRKFIDHTHADAVLALTNQPNGSAMVAEALGGDVIFLPYLKPGFALAKSAADAFDANPGGRAMVWSHHGLVTWGETAREAYEATIDLVSRAEAFLARVAPRARKAAGRGAAPSLETAASRLIEVAPIVRGLLSSRPEDGEGGRARGRVIVRALISRECLDFMDAERGRELALSPPITTDHLIRTKTLPLWIDEPAYGAPSRLKAQIVEGLSVYASAYEAYLDRNAARMPPAVARFDSRPRVLLLPGLGALCAGRDAREAGIVRDITAHTLGVKRLAAAAGDYQGLNERHLFEMEYNPFQHSKLGSEQPPALQGHTALVTGAAGAIGSRICRELLRSGSHVAVTDLPGAPLDGLVEELRAEFRDRVIGVGVDVTDSDSIAHGFEELVRAWGGVDLLVVNAGIAHVAPLTEMSLEDFRRLERVNVEGTLLLLGAAGRHYGLQGAGGDIVLISSKNVFAPGSGFGAYSASKAAAHQLARIASLELAPLGVRVNMVAPDAVFSDGGRRSGLWETVGPDRMKARRLDAAGLEAYYQDRNLLKVRVTAADVARAVLFFATRQTPTTGATIPVDGGLPDATPR